MIDAITQFDAAVITLIILSALMALARGFIRELATLGAFICAFTAAYFSRGLLRGPVSFVLPEEASSWLPDLLIMVGVFVLVYAAVAWLGQRLSRNINGPDGVSFIDRIAGVAFGVARGYAAVLFGVVILQLGIDADNLPQEVRGAMLYPPLSSHADYIIENAPRLAEYGEEALPPGREADNS
ncbi:MAG: CvpA family protein [Pseudomonadota bacterium]